MHEKFKIDIKTLFICSLFCISSLCFGSNTSDSKEEEVQTLTAIKTIAKPKAEKIRDQNTQKSKNDMLLKLSNLSKACEEEVQECIELYFSNSNYSQTNLYKELLKYNDEIEMFINNGAQVEHLANLYKEKVRKTIKKAKETVASTLKLLLSGEPQQTKGRRRALAIKAIKQQYTNQDKQQK